MPGPHSRRRGQIHPLMIGELRHPEPMGRRRRRMRPGGSLGDQEHHDFDYNLSDAGSGGCSTSNLLCAPNPLPYPSFLSRHACGLPLRGPPHRRTDHDWGDCLRGGLTVALLSPHVVHSRLMTVGLPSNGFRLHRFRETLHPPFQVDYSLPSSPSGGRP